MSQVANDKILDLVNGGNSERLRKERYKANCELLETLRAVVNLDGGEQRFGQILRNYGFVEQKQVFIDDNYAVEQVSIWVDEFNLEPKSLLSRVKEVCTKVFS